MTITEKIWDHIASQPAPKRRDMETLHNLIVDALPGCRLWFEDGRNVDGKVVSNPSIGYGVYTIKYSNGQTREYFQAGISANTSGLTVYIMGIPDRNYLPETYNKTIGKASVTGYCIKFKRLADIDTAVLIAAIVDGVELSGKHYSGKG